MLSIDALYLLFLATGISIGFGHCIGMCGPVAVSFSLNLKGKNVFISHLFYHAGRITTYGVLGGLMGLAGSFTAVSSRIIGLQKSVMIFTGILIVLLGLSLNQWIPLKKFFKNKHDVMGMFAKGFHRLSATESPIAYFPLGLLLGLLPCGPVYTALIAAAGTGVGTQSRLSGFLAGMGLMLSFGLGTAPALILVGKLAGLQWFAQKRLIYKFGAILMILAGTSFVIKGIWY